LQLPGGCSPQSGELALQFVRRGLQFHEIADARSAFHAVGKAERLFQILTGRGGKRENATDLDDLLRGLGPEGGEQTFVEIRW
jgi:hypothetical protein